MALVIDLQTNRRRLMVVTSHTLSQVNTGYPNKVKITEKCYGLEVEVHGIVILPPPAALRGCP